MRFKLDENIPVRWTVDLTGRGHEADTVVQEGLTGKPDGEVWDAAQKEGRFFVTQDMRFSDVREYQPGAHKGILRKRMVEPGRGELYQRLLDIARDEPLDNWARCHVVATEKKVRVRRP